MPATLTDRGPSRTSTWTSFQRRHDGHTYLRVGSRRRFGVEIETQRCPNHRQLPCISDWGATSDCSIQGYEFVSPILQGDVGLDTIATVCEFAHANSWTINRDCGLHIHLDMTRDTPTQRKKIAYAYRRTYTMWAQFVTPQRANRGMVSRPSYSARDIRYARNFDDFCDGGDRFTFVNLSAYCEHGTFEIRLHSATLNAKKISDWVALHTRFADAVRDLSYTEINRLFGRMDRPTQGWRGLCTIMPRPLLKRWLRRVKRRRPGNRWELPPV